MLALFSFRGRTSRLGYWRVQLFSCLATGAVAILGMLATVVVGQIGAIIFASLLLALPILLATWFRRLHDRGKGIWWAILFIVVPMICLGVAQSLAANNSVAADAESLPFSLTGIGLTVWAFVEIGFLRGQPGPNRFGDPPMIGR